MVGGLGVVEICFIDGTSETLEGVQSDFYHGYYKYDQETQLFVVFQSQKEFESAFYPREFVKSIKYIEV